MNIIKKIYHIIFNTIIIFLVIIAIISILPRFFGMKPYIVLSGSMEPNIKTGSMAYIDIRQDPYSMHTGDIITYQLNDSSITHRIIDETVTTVITKGDANEEPDYSPVSRQDILGKFLFSIPYLGYLYSYISTPLFFPVLVALFAVELIISFIYQFFSKKEEQT